MSKIIAVLWVLICILLITGGYKSNSFELAQIDFFGLSLIFFIGLRYFFTKKFFTIKEEVFVQKYLKTMALNSSRWIVFGSCFVSGLIFILQWLRFYHFEINAFDFGFISQPIWALTQAPSLPFLYSTLSKGGTYLGEHFSPILGSLSLFYPVVATPGWIFLAQGCLVGSGIFLAYLYSTQIRLNKGIALLLAFSLFLFQPTRGVSFYDFREDLFFIPLFFLILISIESKNWKLFYLSLFTSFLVKENAPIVGVLISFYLFTRKFNRQSILTFCFSLVSFFIISKFITPHFSGEIGNTLLSHRLRGFGIDGIQEFKVLLFSNPFEILKRFIHYKINSQTLKYTIFIFLPLLPLISFKNKKQIALLSIVVFLFLMNLAIGSQQVGFHYEAVLLAFWFAVVAEGVLFIRVAKKQVERTYLYFAFLFCVFGRSPVLLLQKYFPDKKHIEAVRFLQKIPPQFTVATQSAFFPQLSHRKEIKLLSPDYSNGYDLVISSPDSTISKYANPQMDEVVARLKKFGYQSVYKSELVWVQCKKEACLQWQK